MEGSYIVGDCGLKTLKGAPKVIGVSDDTITFDCSLNWLENLQYCPEIVYGDFDFTGNSITDLTTYLPKQVEMFHGGHLEYVKTLKGIHKMKCLHFNVTFGDLEEGGIGLILCFKKRTPIRYLDIMENDDSHGTQALKIIRKYLGAGHAGVLACQDELIESNLEDFAEL